MQREDGPHQRVLDAFEGVSRRNLARRLAANNGGANTPKDVEQWRRLIYRVIDGGGVSDPGKRELLAGMIGVDPEDLAPARPLQKVNRTVTDRLARIEECLDLLHALREADAGAIADARATGIDELHSIADHLLELTRGVAELLEWKRRHELPPKAGER